jgi:hypothetical protein
VCLVASNGIGPPATQSLTLTVNAPPASSPPVPPPPAPPPATHGYWLVGSDGGIFSFGDAGFYGSTGSLRLQRPIVGITPTADRSGYWLVASDGGIFNFGSARFEGSLGGTALAAPATSMLPTPAGAGYEILTADGAVHPFGDAPQYGDLSSGLPGGTRAVGMAGLDVSAGGASWR